MLQVELEVPSVLQVGAHPLEPLVVVIRLGVTHRAVAATASAAQQLPALEVDSGSAAGTGIMMF